jgi:F0F1-type ATP synthase epsilon subunit
MAEGDREFNLSVMNEKGVIYYGTAQVLFVPGEHDTVAIMAEHTPMIMKLGLGKVTIRTKSGNQELTTIKSGIVYVAEDQVTVLADL